jgi:hypothetical protein
LGRITNIVEERFGTAANGGSTEKQLQLFLDVPQTVNQLADSLRPPEGYVRQPILKYDDGAQEITFRDNRLGELSVRLQITDRSVEDGKYRVTFRQKR